uniref:Fibronectin type-III domain-containing protein n=1 Tax=Scleropages formosus TaxID=113540 RepID=A0A8C9RSG3_SCLFO
TSGSENAAPTRICACVRAAPDVHNMRSARSNRSHSITAEFGAASGASAYILRAESASGELYSETAVSGSPATVRDLQPYSEYTINDQRPVPERSQEPAIPPLSARTAVAAPKFNASSPDKNTIILTWSQVAHGVFYTLQVVKEGFGIIVSMNITNTFMNLTDLEPGTTCPSEPGSIYLMLESTRSTGMAVYWHQVQGADSYFISSSTGQNCSSNDSYCWISPLSFGQNHSLMVTAQNQAGPSDPSSPVNFLTCTTPALLVIESALGDCRLVWSKEPWVDYHIVFVKSDDSSEELCNTTSNSCSYDCTCGFTFYAEVLAFNTAGSGQPGLVLNYTTVPCCPHDVSISLVSTETLEIMCPRLCLYTPQFPCSPESLSIHQSNMSCVKITRTSSNTEANYSVNVVGKKDSYSCWSRGSFCEICHLPCGSTYEVSAIASTSIGSSLPSYTVPLETGPCCLEDLRVIQLTQAITNVTWLPATGAQFYIASLTSSQNEAKCHTSDARCLMGCITCGTNYTASLEAISSTSGECRRLSCVHSYPTWYHLQLHLQPPSRQQIRDMFDITCEDMYSVVVAPLEQDGTVVPFRPRWTYAGECQFYHGAGPF